MQKNSKQGSMRGALCSGDFTETFAPVVRYDSLRVLLATVAERDLKLLQFDAQTAFLYGELSEDIFIEIFEGVNVKEEERRSATKDVVCKLKKSLYGLKQDAGIKSLRNF